MIEIQAVHMISRVFLSDSLSCPHIWTEHIIILSLGRPFGCRRLKLREKSVDRASKFLALSLKARHLAEIATSKPIAHCWYDIANYYRLLAKLLPSSTPERGPVN